MSSVNSAWAKIFNCDSLVTPLGLSVLKTEARETLEVGLFRLSQKTHLKIVVELRITAYNNVQFKDQSLLDNLIPNYDQEMERLLSWAPSGFVLAFNLTFRGPEHLHSEYPDEWRQIYEDRNYFFTDPALVWMINSSGNRRWSEIRLPDIRGVMTEAKKFNLNYGVSISRKVANKRSFLTMSHPEREFTDTEIEVVAAKFEGWVEMVVGRSSLTAGELDVLRCLKDGLGQSEIAAALGLSESAIKQRCNKACSKLDAKTRAQAVAIAVGRNYFEH